MNNMISYKWNYSKEKLPRDGEEYFMIIRQNGIIKYVVGRCEQFESDEDTYTFITSECGEYNINDLVAWMRIPPFSD